MIFTIWRNSVIENGFRCNICGAKLADVYGKPWGRLQQQSANDGDILQCPECRNVVAQYQEIEVRTE